MIEVFTLALPFFLLIFIGYISGRLGRHPKDGLSWMNFFVVYLALPALLFQMVAQTPLDKLASFDFVAATTAATYCAFTLAFFVGVLASSGRMADATIQALVGSYSNIGFMGPGVTLAVLGEQAAVPTALILCFDTILLFVLVPLLMSISGNRQQSLLQVLVLITVKIGTHPFIISVAAGVLVAALKLSLPTFLDETLSLLRNAAAPCALFAMGITVALQKGERFTAEIPLLLLMKLFLHPALVYLLLSFVGGVDPVWLAAAVLMASLPPAANVYIMAQHYQAYERRASSAVLIGTLVSVISVPLMIYLVNTYILPGS
ncbi:AEC family transporter [Polycladidibacter stylochi]|uniref:AEC family transporter n=1 Tax=Polycladidibacter stylochi TaxID=1807766 RepID=UPI00082EA24C|nr:AEC family transporter [Pseudovibrio stylochi]